ncbi:MAG: response regulator [Anaerolineae bacterium]
MSVTLNMPFDRAEKNLRENLTDLSFLATTILVIDDQIAGLGATLDYLADRDFDILIAQDGESGLERARYARPDLILLDVQMPGLDGFEICRRLKADENTRQIPVIFMTSQTEIEDKVTGFAVGAVDYITKPFQMEEVLARLKTHLTSRRLQQQLIKQNTQLQQEIAERQRIEEALIAERNLLRALIDNLPDQVYVKDKESRFVLVNRAVMHDLGATTLDEPIGKTDFDFHPPDLAAEYYADEQAIIQSGQPLFNKEESNIDRETGTRTWVLATKVPFQNSQGKIVGLVGIGRDITQRKQAEEALQQAHTELEQRVEARTLELRQANEQLTQEIKERQRVEEEIQRRNRELALLNRVIAASATETEPEAILEIICRELALVFDVPQAAASLVNKEKTELRVVAEYLAPGRPSRLGWVIQAADNPAFHLLLNQRIPLAVDDAQSDPRLAALHDLLQQRGTASMLFVPFIIDGEMVGLFGLHALEPRHFSTEEVNLAWSVASQVSGVLARLRLDQERQRLEAQYYQAQKMEALGRLTGGVAHDFNNLLTVILGNAGFIYNDLGQHHPLRQDVEQIQKAAERAAALTRQLLAFSRQQVLQPKVLNLNDIVTNIEKMLHRLISEDIDLITSLDPHLGQVKADFGQLEQVIVNLVVNARDAMPNGGKLTIETANVVLDEVYARQHIEVEAGPYVLLAVSDTGQGMDAETQARIFEPFFTTKAQGEGTGLGLATVHGIISQSGGHIWVYSEVGHGSTFKVYLPRIASTAEGVEPRPVAPPSERGWQTILLVEDEGMLRDLAQRALLKQGYNLLTAQNGVQARQIAAAHPGLIHLLLTDVVMPGGLSGPQLAKELVSLRPELKVLYMSGYTENAIVHHGVLDPGIAFLPKPFVPADLVRKVHEVLNSE